MTAPHNLAPALIKRAIRAERARRSFALFIREAWPIVEPAEQLREGFHLDALADHLEAVTYGWIRKLLINIPPGHAKSLIVCVLWPAWVWASRPMWRALFASYAIDLAMRDSVKCRTLIRSEWYREAYMDGDPGWELSEDQNTKHLFANTRSGFRGCLSVDGQGTGHRGNVVGIDDPISAKEANSKVARANAQEWFDRTLPTRVNDPRRDQFVMIMQRLHEGDLSAHVLESGGWEHLCLPSEFTSKRRSVTYIRRPDPAGVLGADGEIAYLEAEEFWRDPRESDGDLLFPAMFPASVLADLKKPGSLGSQGYAAQHDQQPMPATGGMFQKSWWRFWKPDGVAASASAFTRPDGCSAYPARALPDKFDREIMSMDANFKEGTTTDFVRIQCWGAKGADRYLLDQVGGQWNFPETIKQFIAFMTKHPRARARYVEAKANGQAIIDQLKQGMLIEFTDAKGKPFIKRVQISGLIDVIPHESKEARAASNTPQIESGNVFLPEGAPWLDGFIGEHAAFPRGKHDDQVDTASQALTQLSGGSDVARTRSLSNL